MNKFTVRPNKSVSDIIEVNRNKCPKLDVIITQEEFNNLMPIRVKDLGLSVRASNSLISNQITNLMDLVKCSRENLLSCDYIGESTANEIEDNLNARGLSLPDNRVKELDKSEAAERAKSHVDDEWQSHRVGGSIYGHAVIRDSSLCLRPFRTRDIE